MEPRSLPTPWPFILAMGFMAGLVIAAVDNLGSQGEVSPIVIVGLLLAATIASGLGWGWRGGYATFGTWLWVPAAHLIKHLLGLPDTLHPNTYASITMLAVFTLLVAAMGLAGGVFIRHLASGPASRSRKS
jgi:hypothetical protein